MEVSKVVNINIQNFDLS